MIHISFDSNAKASAAWASADELPWLTLVPENVEASGLLKYSKGFVPEYHLVKADGEVVVSGEEAFTKIKDLSSN